QAIRQRESRRDFPRVLPIKREVVRQQRVGLKGYRLGEQSRSGEGSAGRSRDARKLRKLVVGGWTAERSEPAIVHAELHLVAAASNGQPINNVDLPFPFRSYFAKTVSASAENRK